MAADSDPDVIIINDQDTTDEKVAVPRKRRHENDERNNNNKSSRRAAFGQEPLLKVLVPNDAAGAMIGKRASNLGKLKSRYGANIRISSTTDFYPGTEERIVILTGEIDQIIDLHNYIIDKVSAARGVNSRSRDDHRGQQVKMVVTQDVAGLVIGKGGSIIKAMKEETGAYIDLTGHDQSPVQGERILTIKGTPEQRIAASRQVISKIATNTSNMANTGLKYPSRSREEDSNYRNERDRFQTDDRDRNHNNNLGGGLGVGNLHALGNLAEVAQQLVGLAGQTQQLTSGALDNIKTKVQIQMEIPELLVGPIMGIQGSVLQDFVQFSGAKIDFSRSELGLSHRTLTMHGDLNQTQIAYHLINQKITQIRNELTANGL